MMYVKFWGGNGYCGCDFEEYEKFDTIKSDAFLNDWAYSLAKDNAEAHEDVVYGWDGPDWDEVTQDEYDDEMENYYESIDWGYEILTEDDWYEEQGLDKPIPVSKYDVHAAHCCKFHGCKYGDENCPVVNGKVEQLYPCWNCDDLIYEEEYHRTALAWIEHLKAWKDKKRVKEKED